MNENTANPIRIELFAGPKIWVHGTLQADLQGKLATILGLLALAPGRSMSREDLIDELWPDDWPTDPAAALRTHLSKLRSAFPRDSGVLTSGGTTIKLRTGDDVWLDVDALDMLLKSFRGESCPERRIEILSQLDRLYRGPLIPGVYVDEIVRHRENYETKIAEVRRTLRHLSEARDAQQPIKPQLPDSPAVSPDSRLPDPDTKSAPAPSLEYGAQRVRNRVVAAAATFALLASIMAGLWLLPRAVRSERPLTWAEQLRQFQDLGRPGSGESPAQADARLRQRARLLTELSGEASKAWRTREEPTWLDNLGAVDESITSAVDWMVTYEPDAALAVLGNLSHYWSERGKAEQPVAWLRKAFQRERHPDPHARGWALLAYGARLLVSVDTKEEPVRYPNQQALERVRAAQATFARVGDQRGLAHSLRLAAHIDHALGRDNEARRDCDQAITLFREIQDPGGEAAAWGCRAMFSLPRESAPEWYLRTTADGLESARLMADSGCRGDAAALWEILVPYVGAVLDQSLIRSRPEAFVLLNRFAAEATARLSGPDALGHPADMLATRKMLARAALRLRDPEAAVMQLGHLLSPHGDKKLRGGPHCAQLLQTYLDRFPRVPDPPITRYNAQQMVRSYGGANHVLPLPLDDAIRLASR